MDPGEKSCTAVTGDGSAPSRSRAAEVLKPAEAPSDGEECPICMGLETTAPASEWKETACGHRFHGGCVEKWLELQESCPMCRCHLLTMVPPVAAAERVYRPRNLLREMLLEVIERNPDCFPDGYDPFNYERYYSY